MLRFTSLIIVLFGTSLVASASDLDATAANLQSHGFTCTASTGFRNCGVDGTTLSDGKTYGVHVFVGEAKQNKIEITIFVQPAEAANSAEVGRIYDNLAQ
jgi:hypothetical protein